MFGTNPTYQNYGAYQPNYNYTPWYYQPTVTAPQMPQQQIAPDPMQQQQVQPQQQMNQNAMQWQAIFVKNEGETNGIKPNPGQSIIFIDTEKDTVQCAKNGNPGRIMVYKAKAFCKSKPSKSPTQFKLSASSRYAGSTSTILQIKINK